MHDDLISRMRTDALWHRRRHNETIAKDCDEAADALEAMQAALAKSIVSDALNATSAAVMKEHIASVAPASHDEAMQADAERYRWLRTGEHRYSEPDVFDELGRHLLEGDALDAAIDAARKQT